jgi:hypothetical protein
MCELWCECMYVLSNMVVACRRGLEAMRCLGLYRFCMAADADVPTYGAHLVHPFAQVFSLQVTVVQPVVTVHLIRSDDEVVESPSEILLLLTL